MYNLRRSRRTTVTGHTGLLKKCDCIKKPTDNLFRLPAGFMVCFDRSAAKWSRWEKREDLDVLLHKSLVDQGEP
ncbi:hypothetical protein Poly51_04110 [Rubripirellula tenax]|uniref:Uncharacterized protein n=1 Tax=Rubripirellula tenax TaxID=2528015 RepID=A0A5C6FJ68_9BACT|nr:hypothetical protein Poly51_04110 [Rubripirellula tenax]